MAWPPLRTTEFTEAVSLTTFVQAQEPITLRWYLDVLRERWKVVAGSTVVGGLLAVLFLTFTTADVTARSVVSLDVIDATPFERNDAASRLIDSETEVALASSFEVSSRAAESLGDGTTAREIRDGTSVSSVTDATVINVSYTADNETAARRGADAVAAAYLQYRSDEAQARIDSYARLIEEEIEAARISLVTLTEQLASYEPDSAQALQAEVDRTIALQSLSALTSQRFELGSIDPTGGSIISPADENRVTSSPSTRLVLIAGVFGGLLVGTALAFVRNATAKRISTDRQLRARLGAPTMGAVDLGQAASPLGAFDSGDVRAVSARLLTEFPKDLKTFVAVDLTGFEDAALAPFIVAASMVELGEAVTVVVVGATLLEREQLQVAFDLSLVEMAAGPPRYASSLAGLHVVFADAHDGRAAFAETIDRSTASGVLGDGSGFTMIVVPSLADEETRIVALGEAEAVVLFVALGRTRRSSVEAVAEMSRRVGSRMIGAVTVAGSAPRDADRTREVYTERSALESPTGPPSGTDAAPAVGRR